ncbi:MAG: DL-endopeptidase inhibitor IseA family protein [Anaerotignum sp.]|nr:DL-endopeptidase inhibitor IseA family protein [Anaerotignum sp.]
MKKRRNTILSVLVLPPLVFSGCANFFDAPPDTAPQTSADSDATEDGLPPLEDNLKELYQDAERVYLNITYANFYRDLNKQIEKDNLIYYKINEPEFDSYDSFKTYLLNYFSEDFVNETLLNPDTTRFLKGEDGALYMMDAGRGSDILYAGHVFHPAQRSETQITFTATAYYSNKSEAYEGETFVTEPENSNDFSTQDFTFSLVKEGGQWKFDQFACFF